MHAALTVCVVLREGETHLELQGLDSFASAWGIIFRSLLQHGRKLKRFLAERTCRVRRRI
jgi:hypothetical protein